MSAREHGHTMQGQQQEHNQEQLGQEQLDQKQQTTSYQQESSYQQENSDRFDLGALFPGKGDPRRPPEWFSRALLYTAIGIVVFVFVWNAWSSIDSIVLYIIISLFIALAVEPIVRWLVAHGWKRGAASAVALTGLLVAIIGLLVLFGSMFVQQLVAMVRSVPDTYNQIVDAIEHQTGWKIPDIQAISNEIFSSIKTDTVTHFADQALSTTASFFSALLGIMTVMLVTYYISAALPAMRRSMCQWIAPRSQERFLVVWTVVQDQISNFLYSRIILAAISSVCMSLFLMYLQVPYWLPLSIFCGLVSQFVPTVGTYIGGALPVLSALGTNGFMKALFVLIYIIIYQQIENLLLSPAISKHTMDLNPAIAFISVLALGAIFGALGAFLALPLTASFQAVFKAYTRRYELIDSPLLTDPKPVKKSKVIQGVESISEQVTKVADRLPRAAKGSSARVRFDEGRVDEELVYLHQQLDQISRQSKVPFARQQDLDDSQTVAISREEFKKNNKHSTESTQGRGARGAWK
ncbi:AI-2E family transporter [Galliscardovia ingluviei]|nr:AI-2E family transporter [Galliscardovia ingluviei]